MAYLTPSEMTDAELLRCLENENDEDVRYELEQEWDFRQLKQDLLDQRVELQRIEREFRELLPVALALDIMCLLSK